MNTGGFAGKILWVDLTRGKIEQKPLDFEEAERFIGGLGLTLKIAYDAIKPGTDALDPESTVVLGAGPLVGTSLPSTSRVFAVAKLPSSDTIGWCGAGGVNFGCQLKNAGFDHIVIHGRSERPVYLEIIDDKVAIRPADALWGLGVEETCEELWKDWEKPAGILSIGQAGENQCTFSMAFIDRIATLGRGGLGAVLGSKNLKAVLVRGSGGIRVADRKAYKNLSRQFLDKIREYPYLKEWQDLGMTKSFPSLSKELYDRLKKRRLACVSCPIGCKDVVQIPDGEFQGLTACTSSVVNLFTPVIYGFKDYRQAVKLMTTLDRYGLDSFEFFGIMTLAKTLVEEGLIPAESVETEIVMDSLESLETWAGKIAYRKGLGEVLAGGFDRILEEFGEEARKHAPALVKGMHPYAGPGSALPWDLFGTMELGQVLDPRGPHVGSGGSPTYFARRPLEVFPKHLKRMGVPPEAAQRILTGLDSPDQKQKLKIGTLLKYSHSWFSTLGSMGICVRAQVNRFYNVGVCTEFYQAVTGIETDLDQLRQRVDRIWTLYRLMNLRENPDRKSDQTFPENWFKIGGFREYVSEKPMSEGEAQGMIEDYYEEWGWDRKTGIPSSAALEKLGLMRK
ncbi:MAG: hypothetical protein GY866_12515 [Proteobacteria bacterium]|nr:hypothetical protein [Pseudomonadota bacterium]